MTTSQHRPREPRLARGSWLWRALRCAARAIRDIHNEQVYLWERLYLAFLGGGRAVVALLEQVQGPPAAASLSASITRCLLFSSALGIFTGRGIPGVAPQQHAAWRRK
jgi:hypothetical protein